MKVRAHTCYLGKTGYAAHARSFFRELSKCVELRVRNFTWDQDLSYLDERDLGVVDLISLANSDGSHSDHQIKTVFPKLDWRTGGEFIPDVDLVLMETDHHYFYEEYSAKIKIAYTVWESTELPEHFFKRLVEHFDYLWVATGWHREQIIKQGYPAYRVFVVNEGVDPDFFTESTQVNQDPFRFLFFGRWDYRKSVPEIIDSFIKAFPNEEPVELVISADNPFSVDGLNSTEERLERHGFNDPRIKIKHFIPREEYVNYIKNGNVLVSCARSEGWNIPLIEAMAAGTPAIYSNWGSQLEFAAGLGTPVKIKEERLASIGAKLGFAGNTPGYYAEPDFENLVCVLRDCYKNYSTKKEEAVAQSKWIRQRFNWQKVGEDGFNALEKVWTSDFKTADLEECVIVMSHADTKEKLSILKRNILTLKRQGFAIIVSSHIEIPSEISKLADWVIIDNDNPIVYSEEYSELSNTVPVHYIVYPDFEITYSFDYNHGYAALKLIKNGLGIASLNGYQISHCINYDYIIDDPMLLKEHSAALEKYDVFSYRWTIEESLNSGLFSVKTNSALKSLLEINSKKSYFKYEGIVILEDLLFRQFQVNGLSIGLQNIDIIKKNNIVNAVILSTFPKIVTKNGTEQFIYLAQEGEDMYIAAIALRGEQLNFTITSQNQGFEYSTSSAIFIKISKDELEKGVRVEVKQHDFGQQYNLETKRANCIIKNKSLITELVMEKVEPEFRIHFIDGPFVEIIEGSSKFRVQFIDQKNNDIVYETTLSKNTWARCNKKYFIDWKIVITDLETGEIYENKIDLKGQRVLISFESKSLGDTIAWFQAVDDFTKKHQCKTVVSTFINELFKEQYPNIEFIDPGKVVGGIYAKHSIGWFYKNGEVDLDKAPTDFKRRPLQCTASDILGTQDNIEVPKIRKSNKPAIINEDYVCIAINGTAQAKYWNNPTGWQEVTDYFLQKGYKVILLGLEENGYMGNMQPKGVIRAFGEPTLDNTINYLQHAKMFVGIGSGLSWLAWAVGIPVTLISGFSKPTTEMQGNSVIRIFNGDACNSCFNRVKLDAGDWNWCPDHKSTHRQFECTRTITAKKVIDAIEDYFKKGIAQKSIETIIQESYDLGMVQNYDEIFEAATFFKSLDVHDFIEIGTDQGGTFAIWSKLSRDGIRISVDLPHGEFGRADYSLEKRDSYLKSLGRDVHLLHGDSHSTEMKERVAKLLGNKKVDFLFIDGDHTYDGVKQDYEMYQEFVRSGGWIGFHDIKDTKFHRDANCRVDLLWKELTGEKIEFIDSLSNYGGIGFIQIKY